MTWESEHHWEYDQSPEANLVRAQMRAYEAEQKRMADAIFSLHHSLPARSSDLQLFTFDEIRMWGLRHTRKRAVEPEDDGA